MVCLVINGAEISHGDVLAKRLAGIEGMTSVTLSVNRERTNVIMGKEIRLLWGQTYITDWIGDVKYQISPLSFFQVNPVQTEKVYGLRLRAANGGGDGLGSVLRDWDDFPVFGQEGKAGVWGGDRA